MLLSEAPAAQSAVLAAPAFAPRVIVGTASDHHAVFELLQRVFRAPSPDAFNVSLEDPRYQPRDRLMVRRGERLIGHALTTSREMLWGSRRGPVLGLSWLATLPEYRGLGIARRVLAAADERLSSEGPRAGVLMTRVPQFFGRAGWVLCGRMSRYVASARALLAHLTDRDANGRNGAGHPPCIRPWRHVELPALVRLYEANLSPGMLVRSEEIWRWLIARRAYDQIYVATDWPGRSQLEDNGAALSAYVITKGNDVLELMADPARPEVARQLLERVCGDAIEMNCHHLGLFAPPGHALTELFLAVGGHREGPEEAQAECLMAKLPDPSAALEWLAPQLHERAEAARLPRPCELGLTTDDVRLTIALTRRGVKVLPARSSRGGLRLGGADLTRLFLGAMDVERAVGLGRIVATSRGTARAAAVLFPKLPLWRAPLDDLME